MDTMARLETLKQAGAYSWFPCIHLPGGWIGSVHRVGLRDKYGTPIVSKLKEEIEAMSEGEFELFCDIIKEHPKTNSLGY